jgi:hypothetical protein
METLAIKTIKFDNFVIEFYTNQRGQVCGRLFKVLTTGKNKGSRKVMQNYFFGSEERRNEWATEIVTKHNIMKAAQQQRKEEKKNALNEFGNPFKIGDVFFNSWGYEQTNIDFYQVVEAKGKSLVFRAIGQNIVKGSEGFMSERVTPAVDCFKTDRLITKRIKVYFSNNIPTFYAGFSQYTYGENGVYQSHYA